MKKIFALLMLLVSVLSLASCSKDLTGKTYVYESFEYKIEEGLSLTDKLTAEAAVSAVQITSKALVVYFEDEDSSTWGAYTQEGSKVIFATSEYKIKGKKLVRTVKTSDYSYTITLVEKTQE